MTGQKRNPDLPEPRHYSAQDARGGEIVLDSPARRGIFMSGLVGFVMLALFLSLIALT